MNISWGHNLQYGAGNSPKHIGGSKKEELVMGLLPKRESVLGSGPDCCRDGLTNISTHCVHAWSEAGN